MRKTIFLLLALSFGGNALAQSKPVRIILVGDSTVALKNGWGPGFCDNLTAQVACVNMAKNGRSTKSYRAEGSWKEVLDALGHNAEFSSTWVFVQFGHNDQPPKGGATDLATEFPANMKRYAQEVRATGAKAVLITPLTRRTFKKGKVEDTLGPWAAATRKAASEEKIPLLDLNADSVAAMEKIGPSEASKLGTVPPPQPVIDAALTGTTLSVPAGAPFDYTHLGESGSALFGKMVAEEVMKAIPELRPYIKR